MSYAKRRRATRDVHGKVKMIELTILLAAFFWLFCWPGATNTLANLIRPFTNRYFDAAQHGELAKIARTNAAQARAAGR